MTGNQSTSSDLPVSKNILKYEYTKGQSLFSKEFLWVDYFKENWQISLEMNRGHSDKIVKVWILNTSNNKEVPFSL